MNEVVILGTYILQTFSYRWDKLFLQTGLEINSNTFIMQDFHTQAMLYMPHQYIALFIMMGAFAHGAIILYHTLIKLFKLGVVIHACHYVTNAHRPYMYI